MNHWGWPQIVYVVLVGMALGNALANHGKPKDEKHSFWATLIAFAIMAWVLTAGGFFR